MHRNIRRVFFTLVLVVLSFYILTPAYIYSRLNPIIKNITEKWQFLYKLAMAYSFPLTLAIINSILIPLGVTVCTYFEYNWLKTELVLSLLYKNFLAILINTLVTPILANLKESEFSLDQLKDALVDMKILIITYLVQITLVTNLVQLLSLWESFCLLFFKRPFEKYYFDYGFNYSFSLFSLLLIISFCSLAPELSVLGFLFFALKYLVDKYNLSFIFSQEFDSQGKVSLRSIYMVFVCLLLMQISSLIVMDSYIRIFGLIIFITLDVYILRNTLFSNICEANEQSQETIPSTSNENNVSNNKNEKINEIDLDESLVTKSIKSNEVKFKFLIPDCLQDFNRSLSQNNSRENSFI